jgi:hypothetical protein
LEGKRFFMMHDSADATVPACDMGHRETDQAITHLHNALELLIFVNNEIVDQTIDGMDLIDKLATAWHEINRCRVHTRQIVDQEELLIPAMGLVNDARLMLESLIAWKLGMTTQGKISILTCIRLAVSDGIRPAILLLESCMQ